MEQNRFYISDGGLFDIFVCDIVMAGLEITRRDVDVDNPAVTHDLTVKESGDADYVATIALTKDMMKQMVGYLTHEIKILEDKQNG